MPDNVNITVNETIENIVINPSISTDVIDVNTYSTTENVTIDVTPNLTTVNINTITGSLITKTSDLINDGEDGINPFITLNDIPVVEGFVPYTGATQDVNLGEFGLQLGNLEFDLTPTNIPTGVGSMAWNDAAGTLDLKLKGGAVTLQIGQETVARVVNKTATNITLLEANYQIVRVTGAQGQRPKVDLALANNDLNSTTTLGLVTENILNNQEGFITTSGQVQQINTTGSLQGETWADGDVLYLSGTVAGQATNIKPIAPIHTVIIGFVEYAHINQGKIFVKVDNGYELEELHNVSAIAPNNNEVLTYDSATLLWKPKTVFQLPELTSGSVLFSNGTTIAQDNANFFWDDTNNRLGIGTNVPTGKLHLLDTTLAGSGDLSGPILNLEQTWNTTGLPTAIKLNITDTASATTSNLINLQVGGVSKFKVDKTGRLTTTNSITGTDCIFSYNQSQYYIATTNNPSGRVGIYNYLNTISNVSNQRLINLNPTYNQTTGGASNTDIFLNRTTTAVGSGTQLLMDLQHNSVSQFRVGTSGNVLINTTTDQGGKLQIKAPGALSTDIALRVRNSTDTANLLTVNGIGATSINGGNGAVSVTLGSGIGATASILNNAGSYGLFMSSTSNGSFYMQVQRNDGNITTYPLRIQPAGGNVLIGTDTDIASSKLTIASTTQGFLPPRMTNAQRVAIATPAVGLCVYCTDAVEGLYINKSTGWTFIG